MVRQASAAAAACLTGAHGSMKTAGSWVWAISDWSERSQWQMKQCSGAGVLPAPESRRVSVEPPPRVGVSHSEAHAESAARLPCVTVSQLPDVVDTNAR